ncbi:MAG: purine-nucleoside phosphorylase [Clostridia bacterium]|nr:purine-nucleoside phosphorylase [Clostridia bacterium]
MTPHNEAKLGEIAKKVLMAGDPLRVKYIAENYLEDYKLVNQVRGMYCYTGKYKNKEISVMAHGMGIPSMGIYSYELFHYYEVEQIIRIGSCGAIVDELNLNDIILADKSYTEGNYAYNFDNKECHIVKSSEEINKKIEQVAKEQKVEYIKGDILCNECFDLYLPDKDALIKRAPKEVNLLVSEMETFALFYNAKRENKKATCLLTVVDVPKEAKGLTPEERETALNQMINLALETIIKD